MSGFWGTHSQPSSPYHRDSGGRGCGCPPPPNYDLPEAAVYNDNGCPFTLPDRGPPGDHCKIQWEVRTADIDEVELKWKLVSLFRFLLSLADCQHCVVIDDQLNILPISSHMLSIKPANPKPSVSNLPLLSTFIPIWHSSCYSFYQVEDEDGDLKSLQLSLADTQPVGALINCCKTVDQVSPLFYNRI